MFRLRAVLHHLNRPTIRYPTKYRMSTASATPFTAESCCKLAPVETDTYEPKGEYIALAGYDKVYSTGVKDSKTVIVAHFDIFGFYPQTLQGADLLAQSVGAHLVMPDVWFGKPLSLDKYPPKSDEDKQAITEFFTNSATITNVLPGFLDLAKVIRDEGATKVFAYGLCWGAKLVTIAGTKTITQGYDTVPAFDAVAGIHPAQLAQADAAALLVPLGLFPSKDEPLDEYKKMVDELAKKSFADKHAYRVYPTMHHGWAGARADLANEENKKQFEDVYGRLSTFFTNI